MCKQKHDLLLSLEIQHFFLQNCKDAEPCVLAILISPTNAPAFSTNCIVFPFPSLNVACTVVYIKQLKKSAQKGRYGSLVDDTMPLVHVSLKACNMIWAASD